MSELQNKLVKMLKYFHDFCVSNNLRYYVIGGTALGTARHQGFIPWDDDIDVAMPRVDYERLQSLTKEEDGNYIFEFPGMNEDFVYPFGKMYDTRTTLIENTRYKTKRGIYIDIFPLDGLGDTKEGAIQLFKKIDFYYNLLLTKVCSLRKGRKLYKNIAVIVGRVFLDTFISQEKLFNKITRLSKFCDYDTSLYVANCVGNWHEKEITFYSTMGKPTLMKFENIEVYAPEKCDEYLTFVYGNWRKLPPVDKRVTHHDFLVLDLKKSYLK